MSRQTALVGERPTGTAFSGEPYEQAVARGGGVLRMEVLGGGERLLDVGPWVDPADEVDEELIARTRGAVLDVGCGPGRLVRAAALQGRVTLGIDLSTAAIRRAATQGLPVLRRSVFAPVPASGGWGAVLLADGNIGIGGDPTALLRRCAELVAPDGAVHVETDADPDRERHYVARLRDAAGRSGPVFPWSELGAHPLAELAGGAGLRVETTWSRGGRAFSVLRRAAGSAA